jgi:TonB family protein
MRLALVFCLAFISVRATQAQSPEHSSRKVIQTEKPGYPAVLKSKGIGGVVHLAATVLANGTVSHVGILGGNPILAETAAKAVMKWKYIPAAATSEESVTFDFNAH